MTEDGTTHTFIKALRTRERERDIERLVALFAPESEIGSIVATHEFTAPEGARAFWTTCRKTFGEVPPTFRNVIVGDNRAALEWITTSTSVAEAPVAHIKQRIVRCYPDFV